MDEVCMEKDVSLLGYDSACNAFDLKGTFVANLAKLNATGIQSVI
jgi:hypothetical protein